MVPIGLHHTLYDNLTSLNIDSSFIKKCTQLSVSFNTLWFRIVFVVFQRSMTVVLETVNPSYVHGIALGKWLWGNDVCNESPYYVVIYDIIENGNNYLTWHVVLEHRYPESKVLGPTWGPSEADRTQVGPKLAPRTLLFGYLIFKTASPRINVGAMYNRRLQ